MHICTVIILLSIQLVLGLTALALSAVRGA